jgi:hypothetical protein
MWLISVTDTIMINQHYMYIHLNKPPVYLAVPNFELQPEKAEKVWVELLAC